jgi:hypothetical protein
MMLRGRSRWRRMAAIVLLLPAAAGLGGAPAAPQPTPSAPPLLDDEPDRPRFTEITPAAKDAIERGLAYLAKQQRLDGSWYDYRYNQAMAVNSFALLALMAGGNTPGRGKYGREVARSLQYHLKTQQPSGLIEQGVPHYAMYSHGMSTLALAEVYGLTKNDQVRTALKKAVELILRCQNSQGGWRYQPRVYDADISVTVMQVMALRAARNAGIHVPKDTIDLAVSYVKGCKAPGAGGGFSYQYKSGPPGFARTAAAVSTLLMAGNYKADEIADGLAYLKKERRNPGAYYWYGHYYAAQAMYQAGGPWWDEWFPYIRDDLVAQQTPQGYWRQGGPGAPNNNVFETSIALIILQIPCRYLPIFAR